MDPIVEGHTIFAEVAGDLPKEEVRDLEQAAAILEELIVRTKGLVIVDFLDSGNWDNLHSCEYDAETGRLSLYWRDYRAEDKATLEKDGIIDRPMFMASSYSSTMQFQSLRIQRASHYPMLLLRGYAVTEKEIKRTIGEGASEIDHRSDGLFSHVVYKKVDGLIHRVDFIKSPIYSILILPKNTGLSSVDSGHLLFEINILLALDKLSQIRKTLTKIDDEDIDQICEKATTVRRTLENVLKVECCYREVPLKKEYSKLLLGDLSGALKNFYNTLPEPEKPFYTEQSAWILSSLAGWSNELSHDSGVPVERKKAEMVAALSWMYTQMLLLQLRTDHPS